LRASNLIIGSVTLAVITTTLTSVLVLRKIHSVQQRGPLRIVFDGSASGLRKGGSVTFDGIQVGEIVSLKLENPRRIVALATVEHSAPIRKDTLVGVEFQGLTGLAAIALTGGADTAAPPPLDADGVPTLTADLTEIVTIRETLQSVDRLLVDNQAAVKDTLQNFESSTAALAGKSEDLSRIMRRTDDAIGSFANAMTKVDGAITTLDDFLPGANADDLTRTVKSMRELVQSFNKRSAAFMNEGRRSLIDISQSMNKADRKFDPRGGR
jgi:phospholipid/cholesterol/gamma-HCH transport system substrate-binding protein